MRLTRIIPAAVFAAAATVAFAQEVSLGKFTLAPGEKRTITVQSATPVQVGFSNELPLEQIKTCKRTCIGISVVGDPFSEAAAAVGTTIQVKPTGGKADVVFENREAFPIPISVFRK